MNICVYGASSELIDKAYLDGAYKLACEMSRRGHTLIYGGGANGVMGATARGMSDNGGSIVGIAPRFFLVDGALYDNCTEFIYTDTMRERKKLLEERSDAFVIAPGGIGTFDEFFEILTLKQLGRHNKPIAVLNTSGYYDDMLNLLAKTAKEKFMTEKSLNLFRSFDDEVQMLDYIETYDEKPEAIGELKNIK